MIDRKSANVQIMIVTLQLRLVSVVGISPNPKPNPEAETVSMGEFTKSFDAFAFLLTENRKYVILFCDLPHLTDSNMR